MSDELGTSGLPGGNIPEARLTRAWPVEYQAERSLGIGAGRLTTIPVILSGGSGSRRRLENPGTLPLIAIEVRTGEYLGEDDIVRFEDRYGRPVEHDAGAPPSTAANLPGSGRKGR
jgi:hypothetical protein